MEEVAPAAPELRVVGQRRREGEARAEREDVAVRLERRHHDERDRQQRPGGDHDDAEPFEHQARERELRHSCGTSPGRAAQINQREQERGQHDQPAGGGRRAEGVVAEGFEIEVDGHDLGRARRAAAGHQPDLGEQAEGEDVAEQRAISIAGISSGRVMRRNAAQPVAPSMRARLVELARDREPRRVEDDEGERQVQPDREQRDHEEPVRGLHRPVDRRQAEPGQHWLIIPTSGSNRKRHITTAETSLTA